MTETGFPVNDTLAPVYLNGQLSGEVAACEVGQVPAEDEEKEAKGDGLLHFTVPVGLEHLPAWRENMDGPANTKTFL